MRIALLLALAMVFVLGTVAGADTVTIRDTTALGNGTNAVDSFLRADSATYYHYNIGTGTGSGNTEENRLQSSGGLGLRTGLYWFDVSSIPVGSTVTSATLSLWMDANGAPVPATVYLSRISAGPWVEGTAWYVAQDGSPDALDRIHQTLPNVATPWSALGAVGAGDIDLTNTYSVTADGYVEQKFDITNFVQSWVNLSHANYGFVQHANGQSWGGSYRVRSCENTTLVGGVYALRPMLKVDYVVPEPSSLLAFATGLIGLAGMAIRRRR